MFSPECVTLSLSPHRVFEVRLFLEVAEHVIVIVNRFGSLVKLAWLEN